MISTKLQSCTFGQSPFSQAVCEPNGMVIKQCYGDIVGFVLGWFFAISLTLDHETFSSSWSYSRRPASQLLYIHGGALMKPLNSSAISNRSSPDNRHNLKNVRIASQPPMHGVRAPVNISCFAVRGRLKLPNVSPAGHYGQFNHARNILTENVENRNK